MTETTIGRNIWRACVPSHKICYVVTILLSAGLLATYFLYLDNGMHRAFRLTFLGWTGFFVIIAVNAYSLRKYLIFPFYNRWIKLSHKNFAGFEKSQQAIREIQVEVDRGSLDDIEEIEDRGDYFLEKYELIDFYKTEVVFSGKGSRYVRLVKRDRFGKLDYWFVFHIYLGFVASLACLVHADFSAGGSFVTRTLFCLLLSSLASGLLGLLIFRANPGRLTLLEETGSLENIEYLHAILSERLREISRDRSVVFRKTLKKFSKLLNSPDGESEQYHSLTEIFDLVGKDEREAFKKAIVLISQWQKVHRHYSPLRWYRIMQRGWLCIHIPLSIAFLVFTILHIAGSLYY